jgi:N-acetylmuramoyl-L-alanine amidase
LSRTRITIASIVALSLLPIGASEAGWLQDIFKGSSKQDKPPKQATSPKHAASNAAASKPASETKPRNVRFAALGAATLPPPCDPAKFKIVVDVGHTRESDGAMSARNIPEYDYNLKLARRVVEKLKADGFGETRLLVTEGKARPSLIRRVASANNMHPNLFLSIHHDSVPDKMLEDWEYEGKKSHFSDRFSGHSLFVSKSNADFSTSLKVAQLIGKELKAKGLHYATQYTMPIMGKYRHELLDKDVGVYRYDHLVVLMHTNMPALLLEAGSIINRDEEVRMASAERQDLIINSVAAGLKTFCGVTPSPAATAEQRPNEPEAAPPPAASAAPQ